uniref:Uncharacterized protein n=1 Tax=Lutzomyia longipalpis TaxID=7200 RepID=A0A1B0CV77_LUTLO
MLRPLRRSTTHRMSVAVFTAGKTKKCERGEGRERRDGLLREFKGEFYQLGSSPENKRDGCEGGMPKKFGARMRGWCEDFHSAVMDEDQSQGMYNQHSDSQNVISGMGHPPVRPAYPVAYPGGYPGAFPGRVCVIVACPPPCC